MFNTAKSITYIELFFWGGGSILLKCSLVDSSWFAFLLPYVSRDAGF